jgi:aldehyde dehydrogenase (NAD+)
MSTLLSSPAARELLSGDKRLLVDGNWTEPAMGRYFNAINPAPGEVLCRVARGDATDVDRAVAAARRWPPSRRSTWAHRVRGPLD